MTKPPSMTKRCLPRYFLLLPAFAALAGCAGGAPEEPGTPPVVREPADDADGGSPIEAVDPLAERMAAGDYEGVLAAYAADSTLRHDEGATWRAGLAAATSGHPGHDLRAAQRLFERLLEEHPDTARRPEAELLIEMIARERELRTAIGRLDRELNQLKAIDLGQQPAGEEP